MATDDRESFGSRRDHAAGVHRPGHGRRGIGHLVVVISSDGAGLVDCQLENHLRGLLALGPQAKHIQRQPLPFRVRAGRGSSAGGNGTRIGTRQIDGLLVVLLLSLHGLGAVVHVVVLVRDVAAVVIVSRSRIPGQPRTQCRPGGRPPGRRRPSRGGVSRRAPSPRVRSAPGGREAAAAVTPPLGGDALRVTTKRPRTDNLNKFTCVVRACSSIRRGTCDV